jgi:hypothetical protein
MTMETGTVDRLQSLIRVGWSVFWDMVQATLRRLDALTRQML